MIKHPKNIEGGWWLSAIDIIDPEEEVQDSVVGDDVTALDEYDQGGLGYAGASTNVALERTKQLEKAQQDVKATSIFSYRLKLPYYLKQVFKYNNQVNQKLFNHVCTCKEWQEWRSGIIAIRSYIYVDTSKYQGRLLNTTPLGRIIGYTMVDDVFLKAFK